MLFIISGEGTLGKCGDNLFCNLDKETQESTCTCTEIKVTITDQ